ncbi:MAG TPA: maleylpyruvate isomerase family mycothiol-dependent enzyme [Nonomuraea sp.]|nr:maleylpyruvate isomerase family mycothiol-dependent enzyme [Nonomuraea sp.]
MTDADKMIAALRTEHDRLAGLVSTLGDERLAGPSGAAEWDISQVLSHLGSGAEIAASALDAAFDGRPAPGRDSWQAIWDRWDAMTRRERADGFLRANAYLTVRFEGLDEKARETLRIDLGFLPEPVDVATAARFRLNEVALHSWDVRVGFDELATLTPASAARLLPTVHQSLGWFSKPDRLGGARAVIKVTTTAPGSVFALRLQDPVSAGSDVPDEPDGALTLPAESWIRLVSGRLGPRHTPGDVSASGAADLDLLRSLFPGY